MTALPFSQVTGNGGLQSSPEAKAGPGSSAALTGAGSHAALNAPTPALCPERPTVMAKVRSHAQARAHAAGYRSSYDAYVASAAWHVLRELALVRDGRRCRACDSPDDLQVHHRRYPPFGRWDLDEVAALTTLCGDCHDCLTSALRARRYAADAGPVLQDVARLSSIIEPGDVHERLWDIELSDHRRLSAALP